MNQHKQRFEQDRNINKYYNGLIRVVLAVTIITDYVFWCWTAS